MTNDEFDFGMGLLVSAFPNASPSVETFKVYERMLLDLDGHVFALAVDKLLSTCKFMPTIAEIRSMADDITRPQLDAGSAWLVAIKVIDRAMKDDYSHPLPRFDDQVLAQAVKIVGWHRMVYSEEPEVVKGQFARAYNDCAKRAKENAVLPERVRALVGQTTKLLEVPK